MAITQFLLQSNSLFYQQTFNAHSTKWSCAHLKRSYSPCCIKASSKFNININININIMNPEPEERKGIINGVIWRSMENVMKASVLGAVLSCSLFLYDHHHGRLALAASGGRMGGTSFSSSSRSRSYSKSSPSCYSSYGNSSSCPNCSCSEVYSTQIGSPALMKAGNEVQPMNFMTYCFTMFVLYLFTKWCDGDLCIGKTSVLKLQVGSLGTGRTLQRDLNRIAKVANTSNSKGLHYVLQESILALNRHTHYCISGYSSVDVKWRVTGYEKLFNRLSIEERGKFDKETLVNVNGIKKKSTSHSSNGLQNEYIVVTIIVVARGVLELPPIKGNAQLKEALQKLASIPSSNIMGVEVLWTPQKEDDLLTEQDMLEDYPLLHPV